jgi:trigger factor
MLVEGCKHEIEITVPVDEITRETDRVVANIQQKVRLPGFRPGKAPASLIRTKFAHQVREDVLENLLPKYFDKRVKEEELQVVGRPNVKDVNFKEGEPLKFKAEFEVAPNIELGEYAASLYTTRSPKSPTRTSISDWMKSANRKPST